MLKTRQFEKYLKDKHLDSQKLKIISLDDENIVEMKNRTKSTEIQYEKLCHSDFCRVEFRDS